MMTVKTDKACVVIIGDDEFCYNASEAWFEWNAYKSMEKAYLVRNVTYFCTLTLWISNGTLLLACSLLQLLSRCMSLYSVL